MSDDLYRGVSLSDGQPAAHLDVSYDHPSGAYAGLTLSGLKTRQAGLRPLGYLAVLGYAHRLGDGASWDVGLSNREVSVYLDRRYSYNYTELYAGLSRHSLSGHVYLAPKYNRRNQTTVYVDLDGAMHPRDRWRLFGHAGALMTLGPERAPFGRPARFDLRAGIAREFTNGEVQLSWTANSPRSAYPEGQWRKRSVVQASLTAFF